MRKILTALTAAFCLAGVAAAAPQAASAPVEMVDNPAYVSWAKCKPGSSITYQSTTEMKMPQMPGGGMTTQTKTTQVLKEIKPDGATVEVTTTMTMNGQDQTMPASTITIPAKIDKSKQGLPPQLRGEIKDVQTGKETIEVGGKKYACETREFNLQVTDPMAMTSHVKVWSTTEVPGATVKTESKTTTPMETSTTMTLTEVVQK